MVNDATSTTNATSPTYANPYDDPPNDDAHDVGAAARGYDSDDDCGDAISIASSDGDQIYFDPVTGKILSKDEKDNLHGGGAAPTSSIMSDLPPLPSLGSGDDAEDDAPPIVKSFSSHSHASSTGTTSSGGVVSTKHVATGERSESGTVLTLKASYAEVDDNDDDAAVPASVSDEEKEPSTRSPSHVDHHAVVSQSSIDRALHGADAMSSKPPVVAPSPSDDEDDEDPDVAAARAAALAVSGAGALLTAKQAALILKPDVRQQKIVAKVKMEQHHLQPGAKIINQVGVGLAHMLGADDGAPGTTAAAAKAAQGKAIEAEGGKATRGAPMRSIQESIRGAKEKLFAETTSGLPSTAASTAGSAAVSNGGSGNTAAADAVTVPPPSAPPAKLQLSSSLPTAKKAPPSPTRLLKSMVPAAPLSKKKPSPTTTTIKSSVKGGLGLPSLPRLDSALSEDSFGGDEEDDAPVRLAGVAWKRRSGFGKHSVKHAWEKRRLKLKGTKLMYFKSKAEDEAAAAGGEDGDRTIGSGDEPKAQEQQPPPQSISSATAQDPSPPPPQSIAADGNKSSKKMTLWEQAEANLQKAKEQAEANLQKAKDNLTQVAAAAGFEQSDPNAPRGVLDIVKEKATVAATTGHSGAPTPFAISIKVKGETKWKICFESQAIQMEWLAALTDTIVSSSVISYNDALKESLSSVGGMEDSSSNLGLRLPPPTDGVVGGGTDGVWKLNGYSITSPQKAYMIKSSASAFDDDAVGGTDLFGEGKKRDLGALEAEIESVLPTKEEDVAARDRIAVSETTMIAEATATPEAPQRKLALRGNCLFSAVALVNVALFVSRMSSTSMDGFWFLVVFMNLAMWLLCIEEVEDSIPAGDGGDDSRVALPHGTRPHLLQGMQKKGSPVNSIGVVPSRPIGGAKRHKPVAGTTTVRIENVGLSNERDGRHFTAWRCVSGSTLMVRSHGYLSTKKKVPSPGELYHCAQVDFFESRARYPNMAQRVKLPKVSFDDGGVEKTWHSPDIFVVSVAIPTAAPKIGRSTDDGQGCTVTMYFTMKERTRKVLRAISAPGYDPTKNDVEAELGIQKRIVNGVRLWEEWCRRAPTDPKFQARFKLVPNAHNLKEIGVPSWITKYNGKPVLIKRNQVTGFLYSHPEFSAMEFNVSLHPFPYLFKQAMAYMKENVFKKMLVSFGFVIEGRTDEELPEVVIGATQLCYPDPATSIQGEDFFAGLSPKSFEEDLAKQ